MGRELETTVTFDGVTREHVKVHLDSRALQVSGRPRIEVPFAEVQQLRVDGERLSLTTPQGVLVVRAGGNATAWAKKILAPPSRAKKLGLRAGQRVAISGLADPALSAEVESSGAELVGSRAGLDLIFFGVESPEGLGRLPALAQKLAPDGALWVVRTKGRDARVTEGAVRSAARAAGLVDVKVVAFSQTQSADKYVIPVAQREGRAKPKAGAGSAPARRASASRARAPAARARKA